MSAVETKTTQPELRLPRPQTSPRPEVSRQARLVTALAQIAVDAREAPEGYLEDTKVPAGGE